MEAFKIGMLVIWKKSCLSYQDVSYYIGKGKIGYAWHDDLKIYNKPRDLEEFF